MTSKERFQSILTGSLPDRVPVVCNLFEQGARELKISIKEYYSSGENVAEGQLKLLDHFHYDQLWGFHYAAADAEMLGSGRTIFVDDGPPNVGHLILRNEKDINNLVVDDGIFETPSFLKLLKTIEILKREKGDGYPILASVIGSVSMPPLLMGMENWLDLLYAGSSNAADLLLQKCSDFCSKKIRYLFDAGVDLIAYNNPLGTASFITLDQFKYNTIEWVKRDLSENGAEGIIYFNGGGLLNPFLETIFKKTGIGAYYINPHDEIPVAKKCLQGRGILAAAINDILLINQSDEQIINEVKKIMREGASSGGFIFGTLVMPYSISDHKIEVMIKAAHHYGKY